MPHDEIAPDGLNRARASARDMAGIDDNPLRSSRPRRGRDFTSMGTPAPPSPATVARYFVTAPRGRAHADQASVLTVERGPIHAKAMGTAVTVCGLKTGSWVKLWDVPFTPGLNDACPRCSEKEAGLTA